jgi:hypothetical protein
MNWAFMGPVEICGMYVVAHPRATEADETDFLNRNESASYTLLVLLKRILL